VHGILQQAFRGEVFPENAKGKIAAGQLPLPIGIVLDGIAVNCFVSSNPGSTISNEKHHFV
jgi:hypothetical protein